MSRESCDTARVMFPIFANRPDAPVYLDSAATTQKPSCVLDSLMRVYEHSNGNVHRCAHRFARECTDSLESARKKVARFIGAASPKEIVFTRGTTESINLLAWALSVDSIRAGEKVLVSALEHHSNMVPWQEACRRTGATLQIIPVNPSTGEIDIEALRSMVDNSVRVISIAHVSNVLGSVAPLREIADIAASLPACVTAVDGAQAVGHLPVDVTDLGVDYYSFSGHKMYGPNGIGVLWGREDALNALPPYQFGGEMIDTVAYDTSTYNSSPFRFEAGTPDYPAAIALGTAVDFLEDLGRESVREHEAEILTYAEDRLRRIEGLQIIGHPAIRSGVISFNVDGVHHFDLEIMLDRFGAAVRSGHHCAQPLMGLLGVEGTVRASFGIYSNRADVDALITALEKSLALLNCARRTA